MRRGSSPIAAGPRIATLCLATLATPACAHLGGKVAYTPDELRAAVTPLAGTDAAEVIVPFEVDAADIAKAQRITSAYAARGDQVRALIEALFSARGFGLTYGPLVTTTARETLARRRGNCLALASVFVGLARGLGFQAHFIDASARVSDVSGGDTSLVVNTGHITAVVETGDVQWYLDFDHSLHRIAAYRVIDDVEALAHFYNNRGFERVAWAEAGSEDPDWQSAARDFSLATRIVSGFAPAWNNLGIAESRLGHTDRAEQAYRKSIAAKPRLAAAHNNLGTLYLAMGRLEDSVQELRTATRLAPKEAHTHLNLARALIFAGATEEGIAELERASELKSAKATTLLDKIELYRGHGAND
jgi:tetratricopeptide (TPR) repeat protein